MKKLVCLILIKLCVVGFALGADVYPSPNHSVGISDSGPEWGDSVTLSARIVSDEFRTLIDFGVSFYLSTDTLGSTDDYYLGTIYDEVVNYETIFSLTCTIPDTIPPGTYYVVARADSDDQIVESNEVNNWFVYHATNGRLTVNPSALTEYDVYATAVSSDDSSLYKGETVRIHSLIDSLTATTPEFTVSYYLVTSRQSTGPGHFIGSRKGSALNNMFNSYTTCFIPSDLPSGTYYLAVSVDSDDEISETDELNNWFVSLESSGAVYVSDNTPSDDIYMWGNFNISETTLYRGDSVTITEMANSVMQVSPSFTVSYYLSADESISSTNYYIGSSRDSITQYGKDFVTACQIPTDIPPGSYCLIAHADSNNEIEEYNEENNWTVRGDNLTPFVTVLDQSPVMGLSTTSLVFPTSKGETPPAQEFELWNEGTERFSYTIASDVSWLTSIPTSDSITTGTNSISVIVDASEMAEGIHTGKLSIVSTEALNAPKTVDVYLSVSSDAVVSGITVAQRPGTKLIEINYDITTMEASSVFIALNVRQDEVVISSPSVSGDIGMGVDPGTGKQIVWDMGADWNGNAEELLYTVFVDNEAKTDVVPRGYVFAEAGTAAGGSPTVSNDFYIAKFEITNDQMREVMQWAYDQGGLISASETTVVNAQGNAQQLLDLDDSHCLVKFSEGTFSVIAGRGTFPCTEVTWFGSAAYCNFLSIKEGRTPVYDLSTWEMVSGADGYHIPSVPQWEYAARGGRDGLNTIYSGSDNIDDVAWYDLNSHELGNSDFNVGNGTLPVGRKAPNELGAYDMSGNVWEWCQNWSLGYEGSLRIVGGGSWDNNSNSAQIGHYNHAYIDSSQYGIGFRPVLPAGQSDDSTRLYSDARDYTLIVDSNGHGSPTPAEGITNLCWQSAVTCSVSGEEGNWRCTGWTGTGSVPFEGVSTNVSFILTNLTSSITWNWSPILEGFALWADTMDLEGDLEVLFREDRDGDGVVNGFEYAFGTNHVLLDLQIFSGDVFVRTLEQDPATEPYVDVQVLGSKDLENWDLMMMRYTSNSPEGYTLYAPWGTHKKAFFKLEAELK